MKPSANLVIGVGCEARGDDVAGLLVARSVAALCRADAVRVLEHGGDAAGLALLFEGAERVVIADAVVSGSRSVGDVHRFDAHSEPLPAALFASASTHALGVAEAVELARALDRMPSRLVVYGIEAADFAVGSGPSRDVLAAVERVARCVLEEVGAGVPGDPAR